MSQKQSLDWREQSLLYSHLAGLGNFFPLNLEVDCYAINDQLQAFHADWKIYNPQKVGYKRWGLSLTSLDGTLSGDLDLTSLVEINRRSETKYDELSFRKLTPVYEACPAIQTVLEPFLPDLGRSHFLKFQNGGYFPYHRDSYWLDSDTFRIFVPLVTQSMRDFVFLLGQERITMEAGRAYFINTRLEHALFSFADDSIHLVLNVELNHRSVEQLMRHLFST